MESTQINQVNIGIAKPPEVKKKKGSEIKEIPPEVLAEKIKVLEEAFRVWQKEQAGGEKSKFNYSWMKRRKNFYSLINWLYQKNISLSALVKLAKNKEMADHFDYREKKTPEFLTEETALIKLNEAFKVWQKEQFGNEKSEFNRRWIERREDFSNIISWLSAKKISLLDLVKLTKNKELEVAFTYRAKESLTQEAALNKLNEAFKVWQKEKLSGEMSEFNLSWIKGRAEFSNLLSWLFVRKISLPDFVKLAENKEMEAAFVYEPKERLTQEMTLIKLNEAFEVWQKEQVDGETSEFNQTWIMGKKEFRNIITWCWRKNFLLYDLVKLAKNKEMESAFVYRERGESLTQETAIIKLNEAFKAWQKEQASGETSKFNLSWIKENKEFRNLIDWLQRKRVFLPDLVKLAKNSEMESNFVFSERKPSEYLTKETAIMKLNEAFKVWQKEQVGGGRRKFNLWWITGKEEFRNLNHWLQREKTSLAELVKLSRNEEMSLAFTYQEQKKGVLPSELIDLADFNPKDVDSRISIKGIGTGLGNLPDLSEYTDEPSELQKLRFEIGNALKTGEWSDELIDKYIEFHSYLPDFVFHHLSVDDVNKRVEKKEIQKPKTVLSVAGGAYGEAIAWQRSGQKEPPMVMTLDSSPRMLEQAKTKIAAKYGIPEKELESVVGQMRQIDEVIKDNFQVGDFDLIECSAVDNLAAEELPMFVEKLTKILKVGQCVQLLSRKPYAQDLLKVFRDHNFVLCSAFNSLLKGSLDKATTMSEKVIQRLKQKMSQGRYYILAQKVEPKDMPSDEEILAETLKQAIDLPTEEQPTYEDIWSLLNKFGTVKTLPHELLAKLGWKLEIAPGKGKSGQVFLLRKVEKK